MKLSPETLRKRQQAIGAFQHTAKQAKHTPAAKPYKHNPHLEPNPAAQALGRLAAGVPKDYSQAERARRRARLAAARLKRWPTSK